MEPDKIAALRSAVVRLASRLRAARAPGGLSPNQLSVLGHLVREGDDTPGGIAAAEHHQPQSLTRVFAELELAGHITRSPSPDDGRRQIVSITAGGREVLARDMRDRDAWLAAALDELGPTERGVVALATPVMRALADAPASTGRRREAA